MSAERPSFSIPENPNPDLQLFPITKPIPAEFIYDSSTSLGRISSLPNLETIRRISEQADPVERQVYTIMNSVRGRVYDDFSTEAYCYGTSFMRSVKENQYPEYAPVDSFTAGQFIRDILPQYMFVIGNDKPVINTYLELVTERMERLPKYAGIDVILPNEWEILIEYGFKQEFSSRLSRIRGREAVLSESIDRIVTFKHPVIRDSFLGGITDFYYLYQTQSDVQTMAESC